MYGKARFDGDGVQVVSELNDKGQELPDPVPMAPPAGAPTKDPLQDMVRRFVAQEFAKYQEMYGPDEVESQAESEDFDIEDDPQDPLTPWQEGFEMPGTPRTGPAPVPEDFRSAASSDVDGERQVQVTATEKSPRSAVNDTKPK